MTRFLIGTVSAVGHVNPFLPIARKLVQRGHEVWWYTGKLFQSKIEATGTQYVPIKTGYDFSEFESLPKSLMEQRKKLQGLAQFKYDLKNFFLDAAVNQFHDYINILNEFPADVLISDMFFKGAGWVHEKNGLPWAEMSVTVLPISSCNTAPFGLGLPPNNSAIGRLRNRCLNWMFQEVILKDILVYTNKLRAEVGLPPCQKGFFDTMSPFLYLEGTVPSFEYPRSDLPPQVHFIGPSLPEPSPDFTPPNWWDELKGDRTVIHVTQGTIATDSNDLIVPTLQALAEEDVLVIATTGGKSLENNNFIPPNNARIEHFIPHYYLLPHVDIIITNGGFNGVQTALANGIPLIVAGKSEDKTEVSARIAWTGSGINLKTKTPTSTQILNAVKQILASPQYRQKAQLISAEIARYDAPTLAVNLLEQLAETKKPVFRPTRVESDNSTTYSQTDFSSDSSNNWSSDSSSNYNSSDSSSSWSSDSGSYSSGSDFGGGMSDGGGGGGSW